MTKTIARCLELAGFQHDGDFWTRHPLRLHIVSERRVILFLVGRENENEQPCILDLPNLVRWLPDQLVEHVIENCTPLEIAAFMNTPWADRQPKRMWP